jgi:uncharacterized protein YndB with AHSA1/START domain
VIDRSDSVTISRPVEEVFAYVVDTRNDPTWHTDAVEVQKTSEGPIGAGTTWHVHVKPSMGVSEGDIEVVTFDPNRTEVVKGIFGPMQPTVTYSFEPADAGTRFTRQVQIKLSGGMRLMEPLIKLMFAKRNAGFVGNLKQVLER